MDIYSHPMFRIQGATFPGPEHPDRLNLVEELIANAERAYTSEIDEDPEIRAQIEELHSYQDTLQFSGAGTESIDEEGETFIDRLSYRTAIAAAVTSIYTAEAQGFALVRPPGHHAHAAYTHGFCLLNNMALATKNLLKNGERVLVLDLDIHHGCGTEELLEKEPDACMISLYQRNTKRDWPPNEHFLYAKNCQHIPLTGRVDDLQYCTLFEKTVMPSIERFQPTIIGVSLGLDTFQEENYGWKLSKRTIKEIRKFLKGRNIFGILEGGYTEEAVRDGIEAFIEDP